MRQWRLRCAHVHVWKRTGVKGQAIMASSTPTALPPSLPTFFSARFRIPRLFVQTDAVYKGIIELELALLRYAPGPTIGPFLEGSEPGERPRGA